jgi:pyridoxamine 5'-phosphate oxidase
MDVGEVDADPLPQLGRWLQEARDAGARLPEAMTLATASPEGSPSARMVLLRGLDDGLVFFTDYESAKGNELWVNPRAAAVLHWHVPRHRQIRVTGHVTRVTDAESDAYWATRPPGARRSASASHQSRVIASRAALEERVAELERRYPDDALVPRPERWGGFRITPDAIELWEEGPDRLHDRLRYRRAPGGWAIERLSP